MIHRRRRRRRRWPILVVLSVLAVLLLVLGLRPLGRQTLLAESVQTVGHSAFFGLLGLAAAVGSDTLVPRLKKQRWRQYLAGICVSLAAGVMLEFAQMLVPSRTASWSDLLYDALGIAAAMALLVSIDRPAAANGWQRTLVRSSPLVFLGLVALAVWPLAHCGYDVWQRNRSFPLLIDFRASWSHRFCWIDEAVQVDLARIPSTWPAGVATNVIALQIDPSANYPGIGIKEPYPDWHAFDSLAFDVYNLDSTPQTLALRVHDFQHNQDYKDRYGRVLELAPGFQSFRISMREIQNGPRQRPMELRSIDGVKLFALQPTQSMHLMVGNFRLE